MRTRRVQVVARWSGWLALLAGGLAIGVKGAVAETEPAAESALPLPQAGLLEQFGSNPDQPQPSNPSAPAEPGFAAPVDAAGGSDESAQVIRRPEPGPTAMQRGESRQPLQRNSSGWGGVSFRDALPLLVVLGLIGVAAWLVKRHLPARQLLLGGRTLEIVARSPISSKQSLALVKLGRRLVLVGVTPERISRLSEVTEPHEVAMLLGESASARPDSMSQAFVETLGNESGAYADEELEEEPTPGGQVRGLLKKVRRMAHARGWQ